VPNHERRPSVACMHGRASTFFLFSVICGVSVCTAACTLASLCQMVVRSSGKEPSSVPVRPACRDSRISTSVAASLRASSSSCRHASNHHVAQLHTVRWCAQRIGFSVVLLATGARAIWNACGVALCLLTSAMILLRMR